MGGGTGRDSEALEETRGRTSIMTWWARGWERKEMKKESEWEPDNLG